MRFVRHALPFLLLFVCLPAHAQTDSSRTSFFLDRLAVPPFIANHEEARLGFEQELGSSRLRIGIGGALDVVEFASASDTIRIGADICAYALSSTISGVLFKIAVADGLFAVRLTCTNGSPWSFRFRAIHLSGHMVDGNYNTAAGAWFDGREPFNFTRNYGEVVAARSGSLGGASFRAYTGISYAIWVRPTAIRRVSSLHGIEVRFPGNPAVYAAYNLTLMGIPAVVGSNTVEAGVKLGAWGGRGVRLYIRYYAGLETFGAFYNERREFVGAGFGFEIW